MRQRRNHNAWMLYGRVYAPIWHQLNVRDGTVICIVYEYIYIYFTNMD